jgi:ABC-2 type transport system ATP-binding protein
MRQKVVISAALLHNPEVIIVDEPMVGLDPKTSRLVKDIFREGAQKGVTVFMSTHMLSIAEEICDRVGIIDNGNLITIGTIDELRKASGIDGRLEEIFLKLT